MVAPSTSSCGHSSQQQDISEPTRPEGSSSLCGPRSAYVQPTSPTVSEHDCRLGEAKAACEELSPPSCRPRRPSILNVLARSATPAAADRTSQTDVPSSKASIRPDDPRCQARAGDNPDVAELGRQAVFEPAVLMPRASATVATTRPPARLPSCQAGSRTRPAFAILEPREDTCHSYDELVVTPYLCRAASPPRPAASHRPSAAAAREANPREPREPQPQRRARDAPGEPRPMPVRTTAVHDCHGAEWMPDCCPVPSRNAEGTQHAHSNAPGRKRLWEHAAAPPALEAEGPPNTAIRQRGPRSAWHQVELDLALPPRRTRGVEGAAALSSGASGVPYVPAAEVEMEEMVDVFHAFHATVGPKPQFQACGWPEARTVATAVPSWDRAARARPSGILHSRGLSESHYGPPSDALSGPPGSARSASCNPYLDSELTQTAGLRNGRQYLPAIGRVPRSAAVHPTQSMDDVRRSDLAEGVLGDPELLQEEQQAVDNSAVRARAPLPAPPRRQRSRLTAAPALQVLCGGPGDPAGVRRAVTRCTPSEGYSDGIGGDCGAVLQPPSPRQPPCSARAVKPYVDELPSAPGSGAAGAAVSAASPQEALAEALGVRLSNGSSRPAGREALHEALILLTTQYYVDMGLPIQ